VPEHVRPQCQCNVERMPRHGWNIKGSVRVPTYGRCVRYSVTIMQHATGARVQMCTQHATMADKGFVYPSGDAMGVNDRKNYREMRVRGDPPDKGKWERLV
jgi:hypothetical protein